MSAKEKEAQADALIQEFERDPTYKEVLPDGLLDVERAAIKTFLHYLLVIKPGRLARKSSEKPGG